MNLQTFVPPHFNTETFLLLCQFGLQSRVEEFIKQGIDINTRNYIGQTPLMISIQYGHTGIALFLLKQKNIDIHAKTYVQQKTALMYAAAKGYSGIVITLLSKGARVDDVDADGRTPLMYAVKYKYFSTVQAIKNHLQKTVNNQDKQGKAALMYLQKIVNMQDKQGKTALMLALEAQVINKYIVQQLIDSGANLNLKDCRGKRAQDFCSPEDWKELGIQKVY